MSENKTNMSTMALVTKTMPFIIARILTYVIFAVIAFVFLGIMVGIGFLLLKMFGESAGAFIVVMLIALLVLYGGLRFVERYFLYMVKLGHVSVIVQLLDKGKVPDGKGMVAYGKDSVVENFGASNVAFLVDSMVHAAVRQIQRWIMRIGEMFRFIPGSQYVMGIISAIMSVSLNYIDEAVMSYVFLQKSKQKEESVWKSASDGVTLYAQSWKGVLKTAAIAVVFIYVFTIVVFLVLAFPLMFVSKIIAGDTEGLGFFLGFLALLGAWILTVLIKRALIDPVVTVMMVRSYQMSIRTLEPAIDLQQKLLGVSSNFRKLFNKAKDDVADEVPPNVAK
ncbi:MAG TPA: hypothetical protein VK029_07645 [Pseudogracilibacillus sp.]|nr:hypothetical protein [Pseudogracilibacillus sp.]